MSSQGITYPINIVTNGNRELPKLARNADKADASLHRIGKDQSGLRKTKTNADRAGRSLQDAGRKGVAGLGQIERKAHRTGSSLGKLRGIAAGLGLMLSTGAIATGLIGTGAGFEKSMSNVKALAGATQTEMVSLTKAARDAGATTAYSAKKSADAMGYLAQAGFKANQQIEALPATLNLAAAGGLDLARSADIATNILSQYRMQAADTDIVVDQLAFTQANFNTNVEEMSDAMNYWGPSAAAMKIGLSESNAVIGLLASSGLKGSLATRALSSSIIRLNNPTSIMKGAIRDLNLELHNSKGEFVGVANMVDQLNSSTAGLTDKQKQAAISTIFGTEAVQEMNTLMTAGADKIKYWTGELDNAQGAAKKMSDTKLDNLAGDFKILQSTAQETSLQLYDKMGPALRLLTQEATLFVRGLDTEQVGLTLRKTIFEIRKGLIWIKQHKGLIIGLVKGYTSLKVGMLAYNVGTKAATLVTGSLNAVMGLTKSSSMGAATGVRGLNTALRANPFGAILGVITAVATAMTLFRDRTREATQEFEELKLKRDLAEREGMSLKDETQTGVNLIESNQDLKASQLRKLKSSAEQRLDDAESKLLEFKATPHYRELKALEARASLTKSKYEGSGNMPTNVIQPLSDSERSRYDVLKSTKKDLASLLLGVSENDMEGIVLQNKRILQEATLRIKKLPEGERDGILGMSSNSVVDPSKSSENIISGGSQQRIINITVEKFQDNINFNIQGELNELRNSVDEMREIVNGQFMRILNSANQVANG